MNWIKDPRKISGGVHLGNFLSIFDFRSLHSLLKLSARADIRRYIDRYAKRCAIPAGLLCSPDPDAERSDNLDWNHGIISRYQS